MGFRFIPTLDNRKGLRKSINVIPTDDYSFFRCNEYGVFQLNVVSGRIKDTLWDYTRDSLRLTRDIKINDPMNLYGPSGIACKESRLGLCIFWSNQDTSMAGCIMPVESSERFDETGWSMHFEHTFAPGEIKGYLDMKIIMYLKEPASVIASGEGVLNNKPGVNLGELESYRLEVSDETIPFPFVIESADTDALWWVEFYHWDDPADDAAFGPSSFVVYLNSKVKGCPKVTDKGIQNVDMMYEITASVYAMLFKKLDSQQFTVMRTHGGKPGTISFELARMYDNCKEKFDYNDELERIHKLMQVTIKQLASNTSDMVEATNE